VAKSNDKIADNEQVDAPESDSTPEESLTPIEDAVQAAPDAVDDVVEEAAPAVDEAKTQAIGATVADPPKSDQGRVADIAKLPKYSRSLLKIRVPISVQLATKKESVQEVIGIAPGSILKFDKGCEELLQMIVGDQAIAEGEAVKIGEKFGFRVTSMLLPREHFVPVKRGRSA
jgi:flagellar motor switch protein FliN/FliY